MYSCEAVREELSSLLDDEVPPEIRREVERHLAECRTCSVLYDSARKTLTLVSAFGRLELPERVSGRLLKRIMGTVRSSREA